MSFLGPRRKRSTKKARKPEVVAALRNVMDREKTDLIGYLEAKEIQNKQGKRVPFTLHEFQRELCMMYTHHAEVLEQCFWVVIGKARQMGFSTLLTAWVEEGVERHPGCEGLVVAHDVQSTSKLFKKVSFLQKQFPDEVRAKPVHSTGYITQVNHQTRPDDPDYVEPSGAQVMTARKKQGARSATVHRAHLSEPAHWESFDSLLGFLNAVADAPWSFCAQESTAKGKVGPYYKTFDGAMRGENRFVPYFVAWYEFDDYQRPFKDDEEREWFRKSVGRHLPEVYGGKEELALLAGEVGYTLPSKHYYPIRGNVIGFKPLTLEQLNWRRWCIENKCERHLGSFHQEYPSTPEEMFVTSGRPAFDAVRIGLWMPHAERAERVERQASIEWKVTPGVPIADMNELEAVIVPDDFGPWTVIEYPEEGMKCTFGFDPAEGLELREDGTEGDLSAGYVCEFETGRPLLRCNAHLPTDIFEQEIFKASRAFGNAIGHVEANNHGHAVIKLLERDRFGRLMNRPRVSPTTEGKRTDERRPGFLTTARTKPLIINRLQKQLRTLPLPTKYTPYCWFDAPLLRQMNNYVRTPMGRYEAAPGEKDDLVMARALEEEARDTVHPDMLEAVPPSYDDVEKWMGTPRGLENVTEAYVPPLEEEETDDWFD